MLVRRLCLLAALASLLGACGLGGEGDSTAPRTDRSTLGWEPCGEIECARIDVPLDYAHPGGREIALDLARRPADDPDPIGSLVLNPGGPGARGIPLAEAADQFLDPELLRRFDIVGWDPRGIGASAPVDCVDDLDAFVALDRSPDDAAERAEVIEQSQRLAQGCEQRSGDLLPHLSTSDTVRDLDRIRAALGDPKLTFLGYSYGSYIGARYAEEFPDRVRALVLDGAVDPSLSAEEVTRQQAVGIETELSSFFEWCDGAGDDCGFGSGDARAAFDALVARMERRGIPAGDRTLGPGQADIAFAWSLYTGEEGWPYLADALTEADRGDGTTLLAISDDYVGRDFDGTYDNSEEAFYAIGCLDGPAPATADDVEAMGERIAADSPHFGVTSAWLGLPCTYWPVPPEGQPHEIHAPGAPPILVIGTAGDPATPLAWAKALSRQLDAGRLLVYAGHGHAASGRGVTCIDDAMTDYLVSLRLPADGKVCPA